MKRALVSIATALMLVAAVPITADVQRGGGGAGGGGAGGGGGGRWCRGRRGRCSRRWRRRRWISGPRGRGGGGGGPAVAARPDAGRLAWADDTVERFDRLRRDLAHGLWQ
jgi:hypothetical protein